jgi:hypothetical protein
MRMGVPRDVPASKAAAAVWTRGVLHAAPKRRATYAEPLSVITRTAATPRAANQATARRRKATAL